MSTPNAAPQGVRALLARRVVFLAATEAGLEVRTRAGELLDPAAAEVILALGGAEPDWLNPVDGLHAAYAAGADVEHLAAIAPVLTRSASPRANEARNTEDPLLLVALAHAGEPNVASNPLCTPPVFDALARHRSEQVRKRLWQSTRYFSPALASHPDPRARERVAANPYSPPHVLAALAEDYMASVVDAVASNNATPPRLLARLGRGQRPELLTCVARNAGTPARTVDALARHPRHDVRAAAARNLKLSPRSRRRLIRDRTGRVLYEVAQRSDLTPREIAWTERYARRTTPRDFQLIRWRLRAHPNATAELRERFDAVAAAFDQPRQRAFHRWFPPAALVLGFALWADLRNVYVGEAVAVSAVVAVVLAGAMRLAYRYGRVDRTAAPLLLVPPLRHDPVPLLLLATVVLGVVAPTDAGYVASSVLLVPLFFLRYVRRARPAKPAPAKGKRKRRYNLLPAYGALLVASMITRSFDHQPGSPPRRPVPAAATHVLDSVTAERVVAAATEPMTTAQLPAATRDAAAFAEDLRRAVFAYRDAGDDGTATVLDDLRTEVRIAAKTASAHAWDIESLALLARFEAARRLLAG